MAFLVPYLSAWLSQRIPFLRDERGQGMIEYGLIAALVAVAAAVALSPLGKALAGLFTGIGNSVTSNTSSIP